MPRIGIGPKIYKYMGFPTVPKFFIQISPALIFLFLFFDEKHNFMKYKSCSRSVDVVMHLLLHSTSWFQEKGMHDYCGGCGGASFEAIFQKIRILDIKKYIKIKHKSDRPTLCKTGYVTLNTYIFFLV